MIEQIALIRIWLLYLLKKPELMLVSRLPSPPVVSVGRMIALDLFIIVFPTLTVLTQPMEFC